MKLFPDYFDPVSLDKPLLEFLPRDYTFSANIKVHTAGTKAGDLADYRVALLGVPEARNSPASGFAMAPDKIREALYQTARIPRNIKIIDLGNIKRGQTVNDTYAGLTDVAVDLLQKNLTIVVLGGSQDLTVPLFRAYKKLRRPCSLLVIDNRPDLLPSPDKSAHSFSFLRTIVQEKAKILHQSTLLGFQQYLTDKSAIDILEKLYMDPLRLGQLREDISRSEPLLRDADLVSIDMNAVRYADAPGTLIPCANGLYGEELCQLARYAGLGGKTSVFGVFDILPDHDPFNVTAQLAAQTIWYFLEGLSQNLYENPLEQPEKFRKYIVANEEIPTDLTFYQSLTTERWWIEVPPESADKKPLVYSCGKEDYEAACNHQITDRLWRIFRKS